MKTFRMILTVALATLVAGGAMAQCTGDSSTGFGTSGNQYFAQNAIVGQAFTGQCTAGLTTVEVGMALYPDAQGGIDPLAAGDVLRATLYDASWNVIGHVDHEIAVGPGSHWITFDFTWRTFALDDATVYHIGIAPVQDRWAGVITTSGLGMTGSMYTNDGGGWTEDATNDVYMRINWDESAVPADDYAWGTLKAIYR